MLSDVDPGIRPFWRDTVVLVQFTINSTKLQTEADFCVVSHSLHETWRLYARTMKMRHVA